MNDGNATKINGLINMEKMTMMAKSVQEITSLGHTPYRFEKRPAILNYLEKPHIEKNLEILKERALELEKQ
jgi:hypothetical protein